MRLALTLQCQLLRGCVTSLRMANQAHHNAEPRRSQEPPVLLVCNLPYLYRAIRRRLARTFRDHVEHVIELLGAYQTEVFRGELCFLEERDGHLAGDDAEVCGIRDLKELVEHPFLFGREVEIGLSP